MAPEAVVTIAGVGLIAAALAAYLIIIAYTLNHVSFTLGTILIGVRAIAARCEPLREVVGDIASDITAVEQIMAGLSARHHGEEEDEGEPDSQGPMELEEHEEERPGRRRRSRLRARQ